MVDHNPKYYEQHKEGHTIVKSFYIPENEDPDVEERNLGTTELVPNDVQKDSKIKED